MPNITLYGALDGTGVNALLDISFSNRSASSVTVNYTATTYLNATGYTNANYEQYSAVISFSGVGVAANSHSIILKDKSEGWQGNTHHIVTDSFTLSLSGDSAKSVNCSYTVTSSADYYNSLTGNTGLFIPAYTPPAPTAPSKVSVSGNIFPSMQFTVNIINYGAHQGHKIYYKVNNGDFQYITQGASSSFNISLNDIKPWDSIVVGACAYNSHGDSAKTLSPIIECKGGVRIKTQEGYKKGCPMIKVKGAWVYAKCIYIKDNNCWEAGI